MKIIAPVRLTALILCIAFIVTLSAFIPSEAQALATASTGMINDSGVNLRSRPSTASDIVAKMDKSAKVSVVASEKGGWFKIRYNGKTGYVRQDFLNVKVTGLSQPAVMTRADAMRKSYDAESASVEQVLAKNDVTITGSYGDWYQVKHGSKSGWVQKKNVHQYIITTLNVTATVNSQDVKLRSSPSTSAGIVTLMNKGDTLTAYKLQDSWLYVSRSGKKGYVRADYVTYRLPSNYYYVPLSPGMKGQDVINLQDALKTKGFFKDVSNGTYGSATKSAVARFQSSVKLRSDGIAGSQTQLLLYGLNGAIRIGHNYRKSMPAQKPQKNGKVWLDDWSGYMENAVKKYQPFEVIDVRTGIHWTMRRFGGWWHADVEPLTKADTAAMKEAWGGKLVSSRRPVWVKIGGKYYAASLMGYVHGPQTIKENGMDGQVCLHFRGSRIHESVHVDEAHQACIIEAFSSAAKLGQLIKDKKV